MNLVWIFIVGAAFVISLAIIGLSAAAVLFFFRRRKWLVRALLCCVAPVVLYLLWNAWLGPQEMTNPRELSERFKLVFQFAPEPEITDLHYRLADGPDDMGEWFRFTANEQIVKRLSPDSTPTTKDNFATFSRTNGPSWWLSSPSDHVSYFFGSIPTRPQQSPSSRQTWIAYDHRGRVVYCFIHSLL